MHAVVISEVQAAGFPTVVVPCMLSAVIVVQQCRLASSMGWWGQPAVWRQAATYNMHPPTSAGARVSERYHAVCALHASWLQGSVV
jgi:hypothetical protein